MTTTTSGSSTNYGNTQITPIGTSNPSTPATVNAAVAMAGARGIGDIISSATGAISTVTDAISSATGMVNGLLSDLMNGLNIGASPFSVLSSDLSNLVQSATSTVTDIVSSVDDTIGDLTSNLSSLAAGPLEVASQIKSLGASAAEALASPVAFVTKSVDSVLEGVNNLPELMGKGTDWLEDMGSDLLGNISKATGVDVTDVDSLKNAIKSASESFSSGLAGGKDLFDSVSNSISGVINGAEDFIGSLATSIGDTYNAIAGQGTGIIDSVLNNVSDIVDNVTSYLPDEIGDWISSKSDSFLQDASNSLKDKLNNNIASVITKVTGVGISNDAVGAILKNLYSHGTSNTGLTTSDGGSLYPKIGNTQASAVDKLYAAAASLCANVKAPEYVNYDQNKDLYDLLLGLAAKYGLADLIAQLRECAEAGDMYFDERTVLLLIDALDTAAADGNPFVADEILKTVAISQVPKLTDALKKLGANLADDFGITGKYEDFLNEAGIKIIDLLRYDTSSSSTRALINYSELDPTEVVLSANDVVVMSATTTKVVDKAIGMENRVLTQALLTQYAYL